MGERLQVIMQDAIETVTGADRLVAMLSAFLPLDQERQDVLRVWVAFLGYAVGRESLMAEHQQSAAELRGVIIQELNVLQSEHFIRADIQPEIEANVLLAW